MITKKQQLFLLELLWNYVHGLKQITRKVIIRKPVFSNDSDFFKQIKELEEWGYVETEENGNNRVIYKLTLNGWAFANIIGLQKNTTEALKNILSKNEFKEFKEKYEEFIKEIKWIP
jgi:DNA-binding MarR family transcriptional regulator